MSYSAHPSGSAHFHVGIADRHPLFQRALMDLVTQRLPSAHLSAFDPAGEPDGGHDAADTPQLLLVDLHLPGLGGPAGLLHIADRHPHARLIVVCDDLPEEPQRLLRHGAMAAINKSASPDQFIAAIKAVLQGQCWLPASTLEHPYCELQARTGLAERITALSPRRQEILDMIADGRLNKQIAYDLGLCESTIKAHVSEIMKALRLRNRTQIAAAVNRLRSPPASLFTLPAARQGYTPTPTRLVGIS